MLFRSVVCFLFELDDEFLDDELLDELLEEELDDELLEEELDDELLVLGFVVDQPLAFHELKSLEAITVDSPLELYILVTLYSYQPFFFWLSILVTLTVLVLPLELYMVMVDLLYQPTLVQLLTSDFAIT